MLTSGLCMPLHVHAHTHTHKSTKENRKLLNRIILIKPNATQRWRREFRSHTDQAVVRYLKPLLGGYQRKPVGGWNFHPCQVVASTPDALSVETVGSLGLHSAVSRYPASPHWDDTGRGLLEGLPPRGSLSWQEKALLFMWVVLLH